MNKHFLISIVLAIGASARLSLDMIKELQSIKIQTLDGHIIINHKGPLNMLRGYIYHHQGLMHKKRFFSSEIETSYSFLLNKGAKDEADSYRYKRKPVCDKPYGAEAGRGISDPEQQSSVEYHTALIRMFPSQNSSLSIEGGRADVFTRFIRSTIAQNQVPGLLAALILLSEGVDVDIECIEDEIVVNRRLLAHAVVDSSIAFKMPVNIEVHSEKSQKSKKVRQKEAISVINFFKASRLSEPLPSRLGAFMTGKFLNSPQFLIQAYLFEFLDSVKGAHDVVFCVYKMLHSMLGQNGWTQAREENDRSVRRVLDRCFMPDCFLGNALRYIGICDFIQGNEMGRKPFPFTENFCLPVFTQIPPYSRKEKSFCVDHSKDFSNCAETGLYALFCAIAYDPTKGEYRLDAIPRASESLRAFFVKHPRPAVFTSLEIHKDWSRVVSDLKCARIVYNKGRNELRSGVLNFLLVIAQITGRLGTEEQPIYELLSAIKSKDELSAAAQKKAKIYTEQTLRLISTNPQLTISCSNLRIESPIGKAPDLYGEISFTVAAGSSQPGFGMDLIVRPGHTSLKIPGSPSNHITPERMQALENIYMRYANKNTFIGCLFSYHIGNYTSWGSNSVKFTEKEIDRAATQILESQDASVNKALLIRGLHRFEIKCLVVERVCFLLKSRRGELSTKEPLARFISNIIGSTPLNDQHVQKYILNSLFFTNELKNLCPTVQLSESSWQCFFMQSVRTGYILDYSSYAEFVPLLMSYIRMYSRVANEPFSKCTILYGGYCTGCLFFNLTMNNRTAYIKEVADLLLSERSEVGYHMKRTLDCIWFIHACSKKRDATRLIEELYDSIDEDISYNRNYPFSLAFIKYKQSTISTLEEMKGELCKRKGGIGKFEHIMEMFTGLTEREWCL
ncbi:uncharacterized protein NEMAJ01_2261 [Nematocida major]|uniref:uncharacterized protein n=1 Tax=Nematocida major TaxID=1912982 RepID=UPI0020085D0A|nr:uncharacterized protein NEMAJ01_2261 [Nematocida major]KAH9387365.1 hypothetical protein NEMAJ01_2261 [Nematocida major]